MLHPGVGGDDKGPGSPGAQPDHEGGEPVHLLSEDLFAEQEDAQEGRFDEEGEGPFHGQGLGDDIAGKDGEAGPVGAELELHGDPRHHAHNEGDGKDPGPEAGSYVIAFVLTPKVQRFEDENKQGQPHGELGKEIVKGDCEGKL